MGSSCRVGGNAVWQHPMTWLLLPPRARYKDPSQDIVTTLVAFHDRHDPPHDVRRCAHLVLLFLSDMPSIFERLRKRTLSSQSDASTRSAMLPVSPPLIPGPAPPTLSPSRSEPMLVDRRIVEDLPALLGSLQAEEPPDSGLKPPRARKPSGLRAFAFSLMNDTPPSEDVRRSSEKENEAFSPAATVATPGPSAWKSKRASRLSQQFTSGSPWPTFGRHRQRPTRSPYGTSRPPSARSSRMASSDSGALHGMPVANSVEWNTVSNLASSVSVDHKTNSRPTESSRDVSALSNLTGSLSNSSSRSNRSGAVTFGRRSPVYDAVQRSVPGMLPGAEAAYTSMPTLPGTYSNESVHLRGNTFPRRSTRRARSRSRSRSRSPRRELPPQFTNPTRFHDFTTSETKVPHGAPEMMTSGERLAASVPAALIAAGAQGQRLLSGIAEPHAGHASGGATGGGPCSPPRLIPPSLSSPTSPTLLHAENHSGGVPDQLSRSSPNTTHSSEREESSWMAHQQNAADTLTRRLSDTRDSHRRGSSTASHKDTPSRARSKRISQLSGQAFLLTSSSSSSSASSKQNGGAGPSTAAFPSFTTPAPPSPQRIPRTPRTASEPMLRSVSEKSYDPSVLETPLGNKGKRKAEDVDLTPPDQRTGHHTTFVIPTDGRRSHHVSEVSKPPSSYQGRKRARLSTSGASPSASPAHSRPGSLQRHPTDSWPSRSGAPFLGLHRVTSKTASTRSGRPESSTNAQRRAPSSLAQSHSQSRADRRRSMSEISFPISALVAPHAPSMSIRSGGYHMRDPRKPPRIRPTSWGLHLPSVEEQGSPTHAWLFFAGFVLFPLWWLASVWRIPPTRVVGGTDTEKAVALDDPQVEHDARAWRLRCRIMSAVSLFTYIPFIVLVAVLVPRH